MNNIGFHSALLLLIASCTTFEDIDGGLHVLRGQPADELIKIIGFPNGETTVAGHRLLVWNTNQNVTTTTPVTTYGSGNTSAFGMGGTAFGTYNTTQTTYVPTTVNYNCTIKVEIDRNNIILRHQLEGNIGGCERYASAIRKAIELPN